MDICESADQFTVTLELAGGRKDDITIELHGDVMTIRGEKRNEREQAEEQPCYVERTYGRFSRSLPLPAKADQQALHSHFADGVLSIEIPKRTQGQTGAITTNRAR
ncbi:MAG: Hsp20/alpha crystallin family protein [Myxococcota bacterium]|nr:Hsp20/alpha crystallin family protein [Myxococcota bacterium]